MTKVLHTFNIEDENGDQNGAKRKTSNSDDTTRRISISHRSASNLVATTINCNIPIINEPAAEGIKRVKTIRFETTPYPIDSDEIRENKRKIRDEIRK
jgi:hypothetical protein